MIELLKGVRVVECAVLFNGDQTGRHLADLGADVIKVEAPDVGDYLRDFLGQIVPHHSPAHLFVNRNKRSVTLNLRQAEGEVFYRLLRTADIFVDGFAGDACAKLGIGYDDQRAVRPDIIYAQCSGFGAYGPYVSIPTHGNMMGSLGGGVRLAMGDDGLVENQGGLGDGTVPAALYTALSAGGRPAVPPAHRGGRLHRRCRIGRCARAAVVPGGLRMERRQADRPPGHVPGGGA